MAPGENIVRLAQYDGGKGLTAVKAIQTANERRLVILSNKLLDERLVGSDAWKGEKEVYPAWSGTLVAYEKPGKKLGKEIVYVDPETKERYVFPVRSDFRGEKGLIAVEHGFIGGKPTFDVKQDGKDFHYVISPEADMLRYTGFPRKDGWYATIIFGIPAGKKVSDELPEARYLAQVDNGSYTGLLARGYYFLYYLRWHYVGAYWLPSLRFGVLAFETAALAASEKIAEPAVASQLKALALEAEKALKQIEGATKEALLQPIRKLVDAAKQ